MRSEKPARRGELQVKLCSSACHLRLGKPVYDQEVSARRLLLASIHDVSPRFECEVDRLTDLLRPRVGERIAMLVVPNHWGDCPILAGSSFAARLRAWAEGGVEMFLHGYFHRDDARHTRRFDRLRAAAMTAGEGEFLGLRYPDAAARIAAGQRLIEDVTGQPIAGFVAPAWLYGAGVMEALADSRIPLAEDHWRVWCPTTSRTLARGPVITWASRSAPRLLSSLVAAATLRHAPMEVLRVGVHPADVRHERIVRSIRATLHGALLNRRPGSYSELLAA
jgi:predicted deacetylase